MNRLCVAVAALAVASSGCSILFVEKPHVTAGQVTCTTEYTMPVVDGAVGVVGIATPFILEALRDRSANDPNFPLYIGMWVPGLVGAISAIVGYTRVGHCRELRDAMALTAPPQPPSPAPAP